jgi:alpha-beta hydrolase superfamily lysophospholipase
VTLTFRKALIGFTSALLAAAALLFVSAWLVGSQLIAPQNHGVTRPLGFDATPVSIPAPGHTVAGWWTNTGGNLSVVLLLPAVRADRTSMVSRAQLLRAHGFSTLLIDLQGQGETPGTAITFGLRESADVVAAIAWIKKEAPGRRVGVLGCSQCGAAALLAPQPLGIDAIVLEEVYPRIGQALENRLRLRVGPLAPMLTHLFLWQLKARLHIAASDLEPIRSIGHLGSPVLIAAGSQDQHTTLSESQQLFDAASNPKILWTVAGAKHQDLLNYDKAQYESHVVRFLIDNLRTTPQFGAHRLSKAEVEQLIGDTLKAKKSLVFGPNQGVFHCCDRGEPYLEFRPEHTLLLYGDGYVGWLVPIGYDVAADGKIIFKFPTAENEPDVYKAKDLHDAYAFRFGPSVYLVKDSDPTPDLGFEDGSRWPYKMLDVEKANYWHELFSR